MRSRHSALCFLCEHFVPGIDPGNWRGKPICVAFPEGIPSEILHGGFDHRRPMVGETITFKLAADATEKEVGEWERAVLEREKADLLAILEHLHSEKPERDLE